MTGEPTRTCVACRTRRPAAALLRLRRRLDGVAVPDVARARSGRSAWLCPTRACVQRAVSRRSIARALAGPAQRVVRVPGAEALVDSLQQALRDRLALLSRTVGPCPGAATTSHAEMSSLTALQAALQHAGEVP
jgi:predicted RNA-binding protein YlxR (DUF448 family)